MSRTYILTGFVCLFTLMFPGLVSAQSGIKAANEAKISKRPPLSSFEQAGNRIAAGLDMLPAKETTSARVWVMYGFTLTPKWAAGPGIGFTYYNDPLSLLPVFLDIKYTFLKGDILPYISLKTGYSVSILTDTSVRVDKHSGGIMFNPAIGIQFPAKSGIAVSINAGYSIDKASFSRKTWNGRTLKTEITYKRFMAGIGFSF